MLSAATSEEFHKWQRAECDCRVGFWGSLLDKASASVPCVGQVTHGLLGAPSLTHVSQNLFFSVPFILEKSSLISMRI